MTRLCRCGTSLEGYHGNREYCNDCQPAIDRERRIKHFQELRKQRKLTLQEEAFELLRDSAWLECRIVDRIEDAIKRTTKTISIRWVAEDIRQFTNYKFPNAYIPYFTEWICKEYPQYRRYFK